MRRYIVALLGCFVVFATAFAMMMPGSSITKDVAEDTAGIALSTQIYDEASDEAAISNEAEEPAASEAERASEEAGESAVEEDAAVESDESAKTEAVIDEPEAGSADATKKDSDKLGSSASSVGNIDPESVSDMPAQKFSVELKVADGKVVTTVAVDAPEGALPAGTYMKVDDIRVQSNLDDIQAKIEKAVNDARGDNAKVKEFVAVDIKFFDNNGNEIEPAKQVEVKITDERINEYDSPVLAHVLDKSKKSSEGKAEDAELVSKVKIVNQDENDATKGTENTMKFESKAFSPYVIIELEDEAASEEAAAVAGEQVFKASEEGNFTVTVTVPEGAGVPEDATLSVEELAEPSRAWTSYVSQIEDEMGEEVESARLFDISLMDGDEAIKPSKPVKVEIEFEDTADLNEGTQVVNLDGESVNALENSLKEDAVVFRTNELAVYGIVGMQLATEVTLPGSDGIYEVEVTYGEDAQIPEDVHLEVTAFDENSEEYADAMSAVVAAKKVVDEDFDESSLELAALDISIVDESGAKVEPAEGAEVAVSIKMKELPKDASEEELAESIEIQHLNESTGAAVLETVACAQDVTFADGTAETEFVIDSFSTFIVMWGNATNTSTNIRWRYNNNNTRGQVTVQYVNSDGASISRPSGINGNYDIAVGNGNFTNEVVFSTDNVAKSINGRDYESAYILLDGVKTPVTRVVASRSGNYTFTYSMSYYNGDEQVYTNSGSGSTNFTRPDVYLQYSKLSTDAYTATVHYVDEDGNELTIANPESTYQNMNSGSSSPAYLIYDIDGYEYSYTYRNTDTSANRIRAQLQKNGSTWQYRGTSSNSWSNLSDEDNIYVVYKPKATPTAGGKPEVHQDETWPDQDDPAIKPTFSKSSTNNGDGTNLISLSVKGAEKPVTQATPADVIVVFDNSYSMAYYNMSGGTSGTRRLALAKTAVNKMADTLLNGQNTDVRMALVTFGTDAQVLQGFTDDYDTFSGVVNGVTAPSSERTNWEKGLYLANTSTDLQIREDAATFVVFVTDGDPTVRMSRGNHTNAELTSLGMSDSYYTNSHLFGDGNLNEANYQACYDPAVPQVEAIVGSNKTFYAIGVSSDVSRLEQLMTDAGQPSDNAFPCNDEEALDAAFASITAAIQQSLGFGDVEITDGITALTNMQLKKSMQTVDETSFKYYRWGGKKETTVDGETVITYDKYGADEAHKTEWTTREADGCAAASYNHETGNVEWNMGAGFQLEDGVTYQVTFRVWPSQEAYDTIANLNNGTSVYSELDEAVRDQIKELAPPDPENKTPGSYTLKTNTDTLTTTYKRTTKTGGVVSVSDETDYDAKEVPGTIESMDLMTELMSLEKKWAHEFNDSHAGDQVKFYLKVDDDGYYQNDGTVSPSEENADSLVLGNPDWKESIFIAPGMIDYLDGEVTILEDGHEYELYEYEITQEGETDNFIASYDFVSSIVRPMRVNGELKYLVKYTDASEIPSGVTETYTIDGKTYYVRSESGNDGILSGTNYRRAELDITKIINKGTSSLTDEQLNKEVFTYRVTLRMPSDANLSLITGWQFVYRPDNPNWVIQGYQAGDEPLSGDETRFQGNNFRWGTFNYNGTAIGSAVVPDDRDPENYVKITMDLSMYPNQVVRLTNLPMGTEYSIEEVYADYRTLSSAGLMSNSSVVPSDEPSNLVAQGYANVTSQSKYGEANGTKISGTIDIPNRRYYNQFSNTIDNMAAADFQVTKHLVGYDWSDERYYFTLAAGEHKDASGNVQGTSPLPASTSLYLNSASGNADRSYGFGSVKFSEEGTYTYTVTEARYRAGDSTTVVDIDQNADTIPGTEIVFDKPDTITVTVSKDQNGSLYVQKVEGARTNLTGTVINTTFNNKKPCDVKILKVGDSTTPLENVQFTVYSDEALTTPVTTDASGQPIGENGVITTDEEGYASLGTMVSGVPYYLMENKTAAGYNQLSKPVVVTFDGTRITAACEQEGVVFDSPEWVKKDNDGTWIVKINNSSGAELPLTGGSGTMPYTVVGSVIALAAVVWIGFGTRRRQGR